MISDACHKPAFTALRFDPEPKINLVIIFLVITSLSCLGIVMHKTLGDLGWPPPDLGDIMYLSIMTTITVMVYYMTWIQERHLLRPIRYAPRRLRRFYVRAIARIALWVSIGTISTRLKGPLGSSGFKTGASKYTCQWVQVRKRAFFQI